MPYIMYKDKIQVLYLAIMKFYLQLINWLVLFIN